MITTLLVTAFVGFQSAPVKYVCPVMGSSVDSKSQAYDYNGLRLRSCCATCDGTIRKEPATVLTKATSRGWVVAESLFDPVTGVRVLKPAGNMVYAGTNWTFTSADSLAKFKANPAKYSVMPKKELLTCPVSGEEINGYASAQSYRDIDGVRVYICCEGCVPKIDKEGPALVAKYKAKIAVPKVANVDKNKRHGM